MILTQNSLLNLILKSYFEIGMYTDLVSYASLNK